MIKLPFHIESPLALAVVLGIVAIVFALLWWSFEKNFLFARDLLIRYFQRKLSSLGPAKVEAAARRFLLSMAVLFAPVSCFCFCVAFGILQNGEKPKPLVSKESQALQQYLDSVGGTIDVQELIQRDQAERTANE